jgi:hypothetical protein
MVTDYGRIWSVFPDSGIQYGWISDGLNVIEVLMFLWSKQCENPVSARIICQNSEGEGYNDLTNNFSLVKPFSVKRVS